MKIKSVGRCQSSAMLTRLVLMLVAFSIAYGSGLSSTARAAETRYVVTDFGAVGDGTTVNTRSIQAAIDKCSASGGGVVVIPSGTFVSGSIFLKTGANLTIEQGGTLLGSTNQQDYPIVNTRFEGIERPFTAALVNVTNLLGVTVTGPGTIDGAGDKWLGARGRAGGRGAGPATMPTTAPLARGARGGGARGVAAGTTMPAGGAFGGGVSRPRLICFQNCARSRISDIRLQHQAIWCLHILYCQDMTVQNVSIDAMARIPSSDGIDVDSSLDVNINHCSITANDDNIAIKCGKDTDGLRVNRPSENVTISDCTFGAGGGICMGSEVSGCIRHVLVQRCTFNGTDSAVRMKSQPSRGGVVEDIVYRDLTFNDARSIFDVNMEWRMVGPPQPPANPLSVFRDIHVSNFTGTVRSGGNIHGMPGSPIDGFECKDINVTCQSGVRISNVRNIDTSGLHLKVAQGQAITSDAPATTRPGQ